MRRLPLLRATLAAGLFGSLIHCGASEEPTADRASAASGDTASGNTPSGDTATGTTAADGVGGTAAVGNATNSGAGAVGGGANSPAAASSGGGSPASSGATGPLLLSGVGGTFVNSRERREPGSACQAFDVAFTPDIPTVMIVVDRSSSMWPNYWDPLRDGVLQVVQQLEQDVRFGFATFTGVQGTATCPLDLDDLGIIGRDNYTAISDLWTGIMHPGVATETPTAAAIRAAHELLIADNAVFPGHKFILLVTDGNPDFCDDGHVVCRAALAVRALQDAQAAGITSFVVGLPSMDQGYQEWMTAFANAGAGQPVSLSEDTTHCEPIAAETAALFPDIAPDAWPDVAQLSAAMGTAEAYSIDPANQEQLVMEIGSVVAGVKSCVFDLTASDGSELLSIAEGKEAQGSVTIKTADNPDGTAQPYDVANGWQVNRRAGEGDQIELVGASCDALRDPETIGIEFGFPCEIIIPK